MTQPESLSKLALDCFAKYVRELLFKMLVAGDSHDYWINSAKPICNQLQYQLVHTVPSPLADQVTNRLLMCLDDVCSQLEVLGQPSLNVEVLQNALNSIIHPDVKRIQPVPSSLRCSDVFQETIYKSPIFVSFLTRKIQTCNKLKVLNEQISFCMSREFLELLEGNDSDSKMDN